MDAILGSVMAVTFNFNIEGWQFCNGQAMPIQTNAALYTIMGTAFGGDGRTNFNLPDLRGRVIVGMGQGANLPNYSVGQTGGAQSIALTTANIPPHAHTVPAPVIKVSAQKGIAGTPSATDSTLGATSGLLYNNDASPAVPLLTGAAATNTGIAGSGSPVSVMPPYLVLNYIICVNGLYPQRR